MKARSRCDGPSRVGVERSVVEFAGIEFIEENGTGEGVRFRKPRRGFKDFPSEPTSSRR